MAGPLLKRDSSLVEEHGEAINGGTVGGLSLAHELGGGGIVDEVDG